MSVEPSVQAAAPATTTSASAPATLGDYTLLTRLASGGMATVYVGRKSGVAGFERLVAIKCCHPHLRDNDEFSAMFLDEARLAASIRHPNVVGTLDVSDGELLYLVMEYIEGCSLGNLIRHAGRSDLQIPPGVALRVMIDTLQGLHAAHELRDSSGRFLNLVHRDVSPQNILLGLDGVSRITDFGIAFASARSTQTQDGLIKGKFSYIAPEQLTGHNITRRMDIFSAGSVLWEALTGRALFRRKDDAATIHAVVSAPIPTLSSVIPELPSELDVVLQRALDRNPDARYRTAADFADALERLALPGVTTRAVSSFVQSCFGRELAERREVIRSAPDQGINALRESQARPKSAAEANGLPSTNPSGESGSLPELQTSEIRELTPPGDDIEHRRMRGILAAAMLLLVGSALGLLMARSNGNAQAPAPAASAPTPSTATNSAPAPTRTPIETNR
ncbi:MAG TPA: serine/threonine-protein kinase [Polyangiaceae bacterium]